MGDGKPRPQRRPMTTIENEKLLRMAVMELVHDPSPEVLPCPSSAQPLALDAKERYFIEWIDHAQPRIEFQTIDDADRIAEKNVFRTQISMSVDNVPALHPFGQKIAPLAEKPTLHGIDGTHQSSRELKTRIEQNAAVVGEAPPKLRDIDGGRNQHCAGATIELDESGGDAIELPTMQPPVRDHSVEHLALVEAVHGYEPIDNFSFAADRETMFRAHQRNDVPINIRRKAPIELELGAASGLAARERGEVKVREADRLFQLIGPVAGQKYQRHMRFVTRYLGDMRPIAIAPLQKRDFVGQRRR